MPNEKGAMKPKGKLLPIYKRLLRYVLTYKKSMLLIILGLVISSVLSLAPAWIVKTAFDKYLVPDMTGYLIASGLAIIAAAFFQALVDFATRYYSEVNGQKIIYKMRRDVYSHLMDLPFTYYDHARTGDVLSRVTSDAEALQTFLGFASVNIISNLLYILGVFIVMLIWDIKLSLLYLLFVPFIVFGISRYAFRLRPANIKLRKIMGRMSGVIREQLRGMQVIKTFGMEKQAVEICDKASRRYMTVGFETGRITSFWMPYAVVFTGICTGAILWYGGSTVIAGSISIGMLSGFLTYITMMVRPLRQTGMMAGQVISSAASAERIFEILDIGPEVEDSPNAVELKTMNGLIEYENVSFSYDKKTPVLNNVSFVAKPGETVAIIGATGAGKTTLMNLLPRFYDVSSGAILIDGTNIKDYMLGSLRSKIGIVLQKTFLFNLTIRENIAFGKPDATTEEIRAAASAAPDNRP